MSVTTLKDVLRSLGEDHNYFDGKVPVNLWRGLHAKRVAVCSTSLRKSLSTRLAASARLTSTS